MSSIGCYKPSVVGLVMIAGLTWAGCGTNEKETSTDTATDPTAAVAPSDQPDVDADGDGGVTVPMTPTTEDGAKVAIEVTEPAGDNDKIATNDTFQIAYTAAAPNDQAKVSLYYGAADTGCDAMMSGWTLLASDLAANALSTYDWVTSGVAPGNYFICAVNNEGQSDAKFAVSKSYLRIDAPPTLTITAPGAGGASVTVGSSYAIQMSGADVDDTATIALYFKTSNTGCSAGLSGWTAIGTGLVESATNHNWATTGVASGSYFICGVIDDGVNPAVYALSAGIVTVLDPLPLMAGLWHFNETSGTTVADSSGNGNNGTFGAGVTVNAGSCQCATFDGTSAITVASPTGLPLGASNYAITAWIKPNPTSFRLGIVGWGDYGSGGGTNAFRTANTAGLTNYWFGPDIEYTGAEVATLQNNQWHFVVAQYDGTTRSLWYDGAKVSDDVPGAPNVNNANFAIGRTYPGIEYFIGSIDEVAIYRGALTSQQIGAFYAAGR